jgi:VanZ family protein
MQNFPVQPNIASFDKSVHLLMYAAIVWGFFIDKIRCNNLKFNYLAIIIFVALYGGAIEIIQYCLPYRSAEIWDLIFDVLGGIAGIFTGIILLRFIKNKKGS